MIKEEEVLINGHSRNYQYYTDLGYIVKIGKPFLVKTKDLMSGCAIRLTTICDNCLGESKNNFKDYYIYTNGLSDKFFCKKCKDIKSKITSLDKYGVTHPMKSEIVKSNLKKTNIERYGVDHYSKTDEYKSKYEKTCLDKYGVDNPFKSDEIKDKIKITNNLRYGVDYPMQSYDIREKSKSTFIENWGVDCYFKIDSFKKEREVERCDKLSQLLQGEYDFISYDSSNSIFNIKHKYCNSEFKLDGGLVKSRMSSNSILCPICNPIGNHFSSMEFEILRFMEENGINYLHGDRKILNGYEIDIYLPDYNIGIEVNGLYWHSEIYKDHRYHINKTLMCRDLGIELLHIWEDDWKNKKDIVKSIILNRLSMNQYKIWARKCDIRDVSSKDAKIFLNQNHIQGFSSSSIKIGLYYKDEIVSLMTFGFRYTNGKREFELIRFCNKINTNVVGSASKLFNHIFKIVDIDEIISYADISIFSGNVYRVLGFNMVSLSHPNYYWVVDGVRKHRFNYSKKKLVASGFDPNKTEVEIMHERGYYRLFSCGQEKWVYKK